MKKKKMLIERSINTWLSFIFSICKGLENVYFICISLCLVWLLWNTLLLHLSNILNTVLPFVMSNLFHTPRIDLLILSKYTLPHFLLIICSSSQVFQTHFYFFTIETNCYNITVFITMQLCLAFGWILLSQHFLTITIFLGYFEITKKKIAENLFCCTILMNLVYRECLRWALLFASIICFTFFAFCSIACS